MTKVDALGLLYEKLTGKKWEKEPETIANAIKKISEDYSKADPETIKQAVTDWLSNSSTQVECMNYDSNVKAVNHRGYSTSAPENTIPAYILSKQKGFTYVECDVSFTSDGVPVLLHDSTIDRTSDGSGNISSMTYAEALTYDFGSWKSSEYTGTKIATFEEFIMTCKGLGLHPYIELKSNGSYTQEQITEIVDMVKACGMDGKVTYISFTSTFLEYVKSADGKARLGYLADVTDTTIATALALKTGENEVFMDVSYANATDEKVALCIENDLPLEIWTVNTQSVIENMNDYITGVTSDNLIAGKILYDKYLAYSVPESPEEDPEERTLLYNWEFTQSLTDIVSGQEASLVENEGVGPTQDENGLSFTTPYIACVMKNALRKNSVIEIDVASMDLQVDTETNNVRLLMNTSHSSDSGILIWSKGGQKWGAYNGAWNYYNLSDVNAFSGKTLQLQIDENGLCTLFIDNVSYGTTEVDVTKDSTTLVIGNSGQSYGGDIRNTIITGVRVYQGV